MYLEGLRNEGILVQPGDEEKLNEGAPPKTEFGKPKEMGRRKIDVSELGQRQVTLPKVNWEPPSE